MSKKWEAIDVEGYTTTLTIINSRLYRVFLYIEWDTRPIRCHFSYGHISIRKKTKQKTKTKKKNKKTKTKQTQEVS